MLPNEQACVLRSVKQIADSSPHSDWPAKLPYPACTTRQGSGTLSTNSSAAVSASRDVFYFRHSLVSHVDPRGLPVHCARRRVLLAKTALTCFKIKSDLYVRCNSPNVMALKPCPGCWFLPASVTSKRQQSRKGPTYMQQLPPNVPCTGQRSAIISARSPSKKRRCNELHPCRNHHNRANLRQGESPFVCNIRDLRIVSVCGV